VLANERSPELKLTANKNRILLTLMQ
jgi:hypothetical protein